MKKRNYMQIATADQVEGETDAFFGFHHDRMLLQFSIVILE